jgi:ribosomal protein L11 methyltransferase
MDYIELECKIEPFDTSISEILMAELGEWGFESFVETDGVLLAYIKANDFSETVLGQLAILSNTSAKIRFNHKTIKEENWNETWEKNYFEPITIANRCVVRSSFHPEFPELEYQITIDPKMAFGTGHHETTSLIIKEILNMDFAGKQVADLGCGTGILAILSAKRGAKHICAVDTDEWSYRSTIENSGLNQVSHIEAFHGDVTVLKGRTFDVLFANINKNVLLAEMEHYAACMHGHSELLLSGFYVSDFDDIHKSCLQNKLELVKTDKNNNWMMLKYKKMEI